jgi:hypothetical protein
VSLGHGSLLFSFDVRRTSAPFHLPEWIGWPLPLEIFEKYRILKKSGEAPLALTQVPVGFALLPRFGSVSAGTGINMKP